MTRVYEISTEIARQLGLQDIDPVLDIDPVTILSAGPNASGAAFDVRDLANPEIYLGNRSSRFQGLITIIMTVLVAGLFGLPFLSKIWKGQPMSGGEIGAMLFGLIAVTVVLKYAHYLGPRLWVIRYGGIHIERVSLNGQPHVETIASGDITKIATRKYNSEGANYSIDICLRSGRRLTSPLIQNEKDARALEAEIARRLKVEGWNDRR